MRDKGLEENIEFLKKFIEEWVGFRDFLKDALKDKTVSAAEEKKFLEIKSQVARKYQGLSGSLGKEFIADGRLMDIISHAVSLESMAGNSGMQFRKIENDWHLSYIHLNELLGNLESERDRIAKVSRIKVVFSCCAERIKKLIRGVVKVVLVLVILTVLGLVGSYFMSGGEKRKEGFVNYLMTVRGTIFDRGASKEVKEVVDE